jgi:IS1 family transposase
LHFIDSNMTFMLDRTCKTCQFVHMNRLDITQRAKILQMMVEGVSIRAISRMTGASKNTIAKLLVDVGTACSAYHDQHVRNLNSCRIQCDEIWSFTYAKQKNVPTAKAAPHWAGDTWTWTAIDADSKLLISYCVGDRTSQTAIMLMDDLAARLANRVQLTTDGYKAYLEAVEGAFSDQIDYAMLVKLYGDAPEAAKGRYSPAECTGAVKTRITGDPSRKHVSTSYAERSNLTMRMSMRRFTRLTNGFSKKIENHAHQVALHFMWYNFGRIHKTLRVTPAIEAGVSDHVWSLEDFAALIK